MKKTVDLKKKLLKIQMDVDVDYGDVLASNWSKPKKLWFVVGCCFGVVR